MGVSPWSYRFTIYVIASAGCEASVKSWVIRATSKQLRKRQLAPCPADSLTTISESTDDMLNFPVVLLTNYFLSCLSQARSLKAALSTLDVICALQTTETHAMLQKSQAQQKYQLLNPHPPPDEEDHGKRILEIGSDLEISPDQFLDWSYNAVTRQDFPPLGRGVDT